MNNLLCFRKVFIFFAFFVVACHVGWAMSVEEAYRTIPHQRTVFKAGVKMSEKEKDFLIKFFQLTDRALVERVETMRRLSSGSLQALDENRYDQILNELKDLDVPDMLKEVHQSIIKAIEDQREFLKEWQNVAQKNYNISQNSKVQSASGHLHDAYNILMQCYPQESPQNKQAFFDYLCALDFL